jgi:hypothetical protein
MPVFNHVTILFQYYGINNKGRYRYLPLALINQI